MSCTLSQLPPPEVNLCILKLVMSIETRSSDCHVFVSSSNYFKPVYFSSFGVSLKNWGMAFKGALKTMRTLRLRTASSDENVMTEEGLGRVRRHWRGKFGFKIYNVRRRKLQT